jgi:hypothetical protein
MELHDVLCDCRDRCVICFKVAFFRWIQLNKSIVKSKSIDRCSRDHRSAFSVAVAAEAETAAAVAIKQQ